MSMPDPLFPAGGDDGWDDDAASEDEPWPGLALVKPFARTAARCPWFSALGEVPTDAVRDAARRYMDGLGFPDAEVSRLMTWEDAGNAATIYEMDTASWEAEEQLRAALTGELVDQIGEDTLGMALTYVASQVTPNITARMEAVAALWEVRDAALMNAATGSAVQMCHLAALSLLAGAADAHHPFTAKFELYEAGHWPVGITGLSLNMF